MDKKDLMQPIQRISEENIKKISDYRIVLLNISLLMILVTRFLDILHVRVFWKVSPAESAQKFKQFVGSFDMSIIRDGVT